MNGKRDLRSPKAFSYAEVMVAALILSLLTLTGFFLQQFASGTKNKSDTKAEAFRQGSQAVARLRREMRGSEILSPQSGSESELRYRYPEVKDGLLAVDALGRPQWQGEARIFLNDGVLSLEKPRGQATQILARLEKGRFLVEADEQFFRFTVEVKKAETGPVEFRRSFRLTRDRRSGETP